MKNCKSLFPLLLSSIVISACADPLDNDKPSKDNECVYTTPICSDDMKELLTCVDGKEEHKACNCLNGKCVADSPVDTGNTCTFTAPKCNDAGTALLTCVNGTEQSRSCKCTNNTCEEPVIPSGKCDFTAPKCSDTGDALLTCVDGTIEYKLCKCTNDQCEVPVTPEPPADKCEYTEPKCNEDGTALLTCNNGKEESKACTCKNNACEETPVNPPEDGKCEYTEPKCNEDGTALLTCNNGKEESKACTCKDNTCEETPVNPPDDGKCTFLAPKCNDDNTALLTCVEGTVNSRTCTCKDGACEEDKPVTPPENKCTYTTPKCSDDGKMRLTCENGEEKAEACNCENGECVIPEPPVPTCNFTAPQCSTDKKSVETCINSILSSKTCDEGCKDGTCIVKEPPAPQPKVTSMDPTSGFAGDEVKIIGENLDKATKVCFDKNCVTAKSAKSTEVVAVVPEGKDKVDVTVEIGENKLKAGEFTYIVVATEPEEIDWCQLNYFEPVITEGHKFEAYSEVFEEGKTGAASDHKGIYAQFGYVDTNNKSSNDVTKWTWKDAVRNTEFNKSSSGNNDEYMTPDVVPAIGEYRIAYRYSLDNKTWKYCDLDSSNNGFEIEKSPIVKVVDKAEQQKTVAWCRIMNNPTTITSKAGEQSEPIYAQAYVEGCTNYQNHCEGLEAVVGYFKYEDADKDEIYVEWSEAVLNPHFDGTDGIDHDEFMGTLNAPHAGTYGIIYAFAMEGSDVLTYCDTTDDPYFTPAHGMIWNVESDKPVDPTPEPEDLKIEWCQFFTTELANDTITVEKNFSTPRLYGQAFVNGCTDSMNACPNLSAYIGYGKSTDDPKNFKYTEVAYNKDVGNNDEFAGEITPTEVGTFNLLYAFSLDGGKTKTYCSNDESGVFDMKKTANLVVTEEAKEGAPFVRGVDYECGIDKSQESLSATVGAPKDLYGQIYIPDCTTTGDCDKVVGANLHYIESFRAGSNPIYYSPYWHVVPATLNPYYSGSSNDEYMSLVTFTEVRQYIYAYSFDLKHDPTDAKERAQRVYCFVNWDEGTFGSVDAHY